MKNQSTQPHKEPSLEEILFAFRRKLSESLRKEAEGMKCPISHIDTLVYIAEKGTPSMKEIAQHLNITPPSTTAIIETMQKKKLIKRVSNEKDRRTVRVELTNKAWGLLKSLHKRKFEIFTGMLSRLSEPDKKQFIKILTILIKE